MSEEDIIHMALDTGFDADDEITLASLERFAAIVAAAEREACAKVCELMYDYGWLDAKRCATAIRARGEK